MYAVLPQVDKEIFKRLIEVYHAAPNELDYEGNTLLHLAVLVNNEEIARDLVSESIDSHFDRISRLSINLIGSVAAKTHITSDAERIKDALKESNRYFKWGIDKKNKSILRETPLDFAILKKNLTLVKLFHANKAKFNLGMLEQVSGTEAWDIVRWMIEEKIYSEKDYKHLDGETKTKIKENCPDLADIFV